MQKATLVPKILDHFGADLQGVTIAIWGLAFKPGTDDIREAPSLVVIDKLLEAGANLRVFDPVAMENVRSLYGKRLDYCSQQDDALRDAHALVILTEWRQFAHPDFEAIEKLMAGNVIFDGRNVLDVSEVRRAGFVYHSVGRPAMGACGTAGNVGEPATASIPGWVQDTTGGDTTPDVICDNPV